jgi:hypothetical protein
MPRGRPKGSGPTPSSFKPGQSGNPAGYTIEDREFQRMARTRSPEAFNFMLEAMRSKKWPQGLRLRAAEVIIERAHGRAPQAHLIEARVVGLTCTPEDLLALATELSTTERDSILPAAALLGPGSSDATLASEGGDTADGDREN